MAHTIRIRKGLDIRLKGAASGAISTIALGERIAVHPSDYAGLTPKMFVKAGDVVQCGDVLFYDKNHPEVKYVSPVAGTVQEPVRGAKRRILRVEVIVATGADAAGGNRSIPQLDNSASAEAVRAAMLEGGLWPMLRQRPFDVVPEPDCIVRDIFVSGFDSAPLAPSAAQQLEGRLDAFQRGINFLRVCAPKDRNVQLGVSAGDDTFNDVQGVDLTVFNGPHPAGNVGVHIHHVAPVNAGETVWTIAMQDVANLGDSLSSGTYVNRRVVALTGSRAQTALLSCTAGTLIGDLTAGRVESVGTRVISGNALTGVQRDGKDALGAFHHQITCIPEGEDPQFFLTKGWMGPGFDKFSASRTFPTWLMPKSASFDLNTNLNGEERAFVMSGQYEAVFPFDIYPVHLVKSIIVGDLDRMEQLGIYEVAPEDFALCEYVCTSKIATQKTVREGLDTMRTELG
jgi:Na+-transporting NADH:ubiquinone oxidoreductase subunit A